MQVSTSQFQFAHGKQPRGYGQWAFEFKYSAPQFPSVWSEPMFFTGKYSEAKSRAVAFAVTSKASEVRVCS